MLKAITRALSIIRERYHRWRAKELYADADLLAWRGDGHMEIAERLAVRREANR